MGREALNRPTCDLSEVFMHRCSLNWLTWCHLYCSFDLMYLSDFKGEFMKKYGALVLVSASHLLMIWTRCDRWSLFSSLSLHYRRMLTRGVMDARGPRLGWRLLPASGSHGSIVLNTAINHTRTGGHAVLNTASHPHKCGGTSAWAQRTLCTLDTRVIVRPKALLDGETRW